MIDSWALNNKRDSCRYSLFLVLIFTKRNRTSTKDIGYGYIVLSWSLEIQQKHYPGL